jgi:transcriptional/translational regulatory protein YebC/TACO1
MIAAGFVPEQAEVIEKPATTTDVTFDDVEKIMGLIDALEDLDDVQAVYTNADFSDEVMDRLSQ